MGNYKMKWSVAAAVAALAGTAFAASPWSEADIERMSQKSSPQAVMLSICEGNPQLDALKAIATAGVKATVFVSAKALSDPGLRSILIARSDLFEVGNLGKECSSRRVLEEGLKVIRSQAALKGAESIDAKKNVERFADNVLAGAKEIKSALGVTPKFYAFGSDFDQPRHDPYVQDRLISSTIAYLQKPTPEARYNIMSSSKAVFDAWVIFGKLDRGQPGGLAGGNSYSEETIERVLVKQGVKKTAKKASEAWNSKKRDWLASEIIEKMNSDAGEVR